MYFTDDSLLPENQPPLMITVAPYGPMWMPGDCKPIYKLQVAWEEQGGCGHIHAGEWETDVAATSESHNRGSAESRARAGAGLCL